MEDIMKNPRVLVIGDSCEDIYVYGNSTRLCPDAPVPVLKVKDIIVTGGMAGNVVSNLRELGCRVKFITNPTNIQKIRYVDQRTNHMFVRADIGDDSTRPISSTLLKEIDWDKFDVVVVSDYDKGFLTYNDLEYISKQHPSTFIDTKKIIDGRIGEYSFIKVNINEYLNSLVILPPKIKEKLIVTSGKDGASFRGKEYPVPQVNIKDTSGAGDTFLAGLVYAWFTTSNIDEAIKYANKCATYVVQLKGTAKLNKNKI